MNSVGVLILLVTLVLATAVGLALRARDGRIRRAPDAVRPAARAGGWMLADVDPAVGDRVLLLQLSSPVCTPCRRTAEVLGGLDWAGVVHREVDVAEHPDVARALGVMRTPTVVAFDRDGTELLRVSGVPKPAELRAALAPALPAT